MTAIRGALVGAALLAAGYLAGRQSAPAGPAEKLEVPAAELDRPGELEPALLAWDLRVTRCLELLAIWEDGDLGNPDQAARVRKALAGLGYRA